MQKSSVNCNLKYNKPIIHLLNYEFATDYQKTLKLNKKITIIVSVYANYLTKL